MRLRTTFLWMMIVSLAAAALLGITVVIVDDLGRFGERALVTSLLVGAFSLTALGCAFALDRRRHRIAMWIGIGASIGALAMWMLVVWFDAWSWSDPWDELTWKFGFTFTIVAIWGMHLGLLSLAPIQRPSWRMVRQATLITAGALAGLLILILWPEYDEDWTWKTVAVLSILGSCGTLVSPILGFIEKIRHRGEPGAVQKRIAVHLTCPRCGTAQAMKSGRDTCGNCGLRIEMQVEEPRCRCGYLLYGLEGECCPECGRAIEEKDRWEGAVREGN